MYINLSKFTAFEMMCMPPLEFSDLFSLIDWKLEVVNRVLASKLC